MYLCNEFQTNDMKKLSLNQIRKPLNFKIQKGISMDIDEFLEIYDDVVVDYDVYLPTKDMNLQRPLVWTLEQKQELIISVLKGIDLASISVIIYRDDMSDKGKTKKIQTTKVIDGKQRISTLVSFIRNEFPLIIDGNTYYYSDLDDDALYPLNGFYFKSDRVYEYPDKLISDDDKIAWFEMINFAGTPQEIDHLNKLKR